VAADVVPAGPYLPAAQGVPAQTLSEIAPDEREYLPAAQSVQLLDEEEVEYDPAAHEMQAVAPVAAEYVPAAHPVHALETDEGEYLPVVHSVQLLDEEDENEPAEHEMQGEDVEAPMCTNDVGYGGFKNR